MTRTKITADMLRDKAACADQLTIFRRLWPTGTTVTLRSCRRAARAGLDLDWFARNVLTHTAWKVYLAGEAPAWKLYADSKATARKLYDESTATALAKAWATQTEKEAK